MLGQECRKSDSPHTDHPGLPRKTYAARNLNALHQSSTPPVALPVLTLTMRSSKS